MLPNKVCVRSVKYQFLVEQAPYSARRLLNLVGTFNSQFDGFFGITDAVRKNLSSRRAWTYLSIVIFVDFYRARFCYHKCANLFTLPVFPLGNCSLYGPIFELIMLICLGIDYFRLISQHPKGGYEDAIVINRSIATLAILRQASDVSLT